MKLKNQMYALIIAEKNAINNECKNLYCRNDKLNTEQVPQLYGNHLGSISI